MIGYLFIAIFYVTTLSAIVNLTPLPSGQSGAWQSLLAFLVDVSKVKDWSSFAFKMLVTLFILTLCVVGVFDRFWQYEVGTDTHLNFKAAAIALLGGLVMAVIQFFKILIETKQEHGIFRIIFAIFFAPLRGLVFAIILIPLAFLLIYGLVFIFNKPFHGNFEARPIIKLEINKKGQLKVYDYLWLSEYDSRLYIGESNVTESNHQWQHCFNKVNEERKIGIDTYAFCKPKGPLTAITLIPQQAIAYNDNIYFDHYTIIKR